MLVFLPLVFFPWLLLSFSLSTSAQVQILILSFPAGLAPTFTTALGRHFVLRVFSCVDNVLWPSYG